MKKMDLEQIEALERLAELKRQGLLTDAEVEGEKNRILFEVRPGEVHPVGVRPCRRRSTPNSV